MNEELREKIKQAIVTDLVVKYHMDSQDAEQGAEEVMQFELLDILYLKLVSAAHSLASITRCKVKTMESQWYRGEIHKLIHAREALEEIDL